MVRYNPVDYQYLGYFEFSIGVLDYLGFPGFFRTFSLYYQYKKEINTGFIFVSAWRCSTNLVSQKGDLLKKNEKVKIQEEKKNTFLVCVFSSGFFFRANPDYRV